MLKFSIFSSWFKHLCFGNILCFLYRQRVKGNRVLKTAMCRGYLISHSSPHGHPLLWLLWYNSRNLPSFPVKVVRNVENFGCHFCYAFICQANKSTDYFNTKKYIPHRA